MSQSCGVDEAWPNLPVGPVLSIFEKTHDVRDYADRIERAETKIKSQIQTRRLAVTGYIYL